MTRQVINVGTSANDNSGDTLRIGANKINSNFIELYNKDRVIFDRLLPGSNITLTKNGDNCTINASAAPYTLPISNSATLGGVKVDGNSIAIDGNGVISVPNVVVTTGSYSNPSWISSLSYAKLTNIPPPFSLSIASTNSLGGVMVDGDTIVIDSNGVISTTEVTDIVGNSGSVTNGVYTTGSYADPTWITSLAYSKVTGAPDAYTLPKATAMILGGVKVDGMSIIVDQDGVISALSSVYSLPTASTTTLGGVKVDGSTITISNGIISSSSGGTGLATRMDLQGTTTSIAAGATQNLTITGYKGYVLYKITTSSSVGGCWVRIYTDVASRTADALRLQTVDPTTSGVVAEVITTSDTTVVIAPGVIGFNNEATPTNNIELAVTNTTATAGIFTITLTVLRLEN